MRGERKNSITRMELLRTDVSPSYMKNMNIEKKHMGIWHITIACSYSEKKMVVRLEND